MVTLAHYLCIHHSVAQYIHIYIYIYIYVAFSGKQLEAYCFQQFPMYNTRSGFFAVALCLKKLDAFVGC